MTSYIKEVGIDVGFVDEDPPEEDKTESGERMGLIRRDDNRRSDGGLITNSRSRTTLRAQGRGGAMNNGMMHLLAK